eukprot:s14_g29.t1
MSYVLLLLAFFRPRTCGGIFSGGCSALCDLDSLQVRAISLFGRSEESRWVLPITGRQKLSLDDLQHVNTLRQAVSTAFEVDDDAAGKEQGKDRKDSAKPGARPRGRRIYIKEDAETTRALGLLLGSVGGGRCPFDVEETPSSSSDAKGKAGGSTGSRATKAVEAAKEDASKPSKDVSADGKKARLLGDVWIDIAEEGAAEEALGERDFLRDPAPGGAASGVFLSFEDLGKETADPAADAAMPSPEAPPTPGKAEAGDAPRFAFLPELSLSQALKERAESFLAMQTEVGRGMRKQRHRMCSKKQKKMWWLSAVSLAPQCEHLDSYLDQYEVALISWRDSGNNLFQPLLACHLPRGITPAVLSTQTLSRLDRLRKLGANITFHSLSFIDRAPDARLHAVPKMKKQTVDVECVAGTYMRLDIPQILDNAMAFQGDAGMQYDARHILYTDMDIMWWRKARAEIAGLGICKRSGEWSHQDERPEPHFGHLGSWAQLGISTAAPPAGHVTASPKPKAPSIHPEPSQGELLISSQDQGLLNSFFDQNPGRAFLKDKWNYKMFWSGSNETAIVHYWAVKPSDGLRCFLRERSQDRQPWRLYLLLWEAGQEFVTASQENCGEIDTGLIPKNKQDFQTEALAIALSVDENMTFLQESLAKFDRFSALRDLAFTQ